MIDVHCHLNLKAFTEDYDAVIKRAHKAGVSTIINTGTQVSSSKRAVELAQEYENLYAIVGVHPHHADKPERDWEEELEELTKQPKVVGIGECGLDYYSYKSNGIVEPKQQKEVFTKQIELAYKTKLPLQIHNRQAGEDVVDILKNHKSYLLNSPGMFHCFAGNMEVLKSALNMGFYIGFDGNVTYDGIAKGETTNLKDIAKYTPLNRMLVETDSPFLTPEPHRGKRNMPEYAIIVGEFIAQLKGIPYSTFDQHITQNAETVFKLNSKQ